MSIEQNLWETANQLRANSNLKASEYSSPVLGLIFLKFADNKFNILEKEFSKKLSKKRKITKDYYLAKGAMYLNSNARFKYLLQLPEGENIGQKLDEAMALIEKDNSDLKNTLPKMYGKLDNSILIELIRLIDNIPEDIEGDVFGKIYEYFLGKFAMSEGRRGGEFFTPTSIVKLIVEIIEPFEGRIYDPACGSGGMFVQSAKFIKKNRLSPTKKISVYGQEKEEDTVKLSKMNLAVHGLGGDIKQGISYYEDLHESINKFDYAMANPPFNVSGVNKEKIKKDKRFFLGIPSNDNANYLWIQMIYSALNDKGKAGLVMANIASESRSSELEIRKKLILTKSIDVVISVRANFFYTVTNACTLWFFDKNKINDTRKNKILFIDAREIFEKIDSTHYEFSDEQIQFISNIIKLRKGHLFDKLNSNKLFKNLFPNKKYIDIKGLCRDVDISEIEKKDWSLNVGKYIELEREAVDENKVLNLEKIQNEIIEMDEESKKLTENLIKSINEINK